MARRVVGRVVALVIWAGRRGGLVGRPGNARGWGWLMVVNIESPGDDGLKSLQGKAFTSR